MKAGRIFISILVGLIFVNLFVPEAGRGRQISLGELKVGQEISLPSPNLKGSMSVEEALAKRRSIRSFQDRSLTLNQISQLLWAAQGITEPQRRLRTAPSAGATYPYEVYFVTKEGVFRYIPQGHKASKVKNGDVRGSLAQAAYGQQWVRQAPLTIILSAIFSRTTQRYGERGKMYVYIEAGHIAQNVHLQAVGLGLGSVPVGAFDPESVKKAGGVAEGEVVYLIPVGYPAVR